MSIPEKDIKILWGLAAGRCSKPGCGDECVKFLSADDPTIIGEMAHVIGKKPNGPRGVLKGGDDTYANLILLCPTHHREVDKSPEGVFPAKLLHQWKSDHEEAIRETLAVPFYNDISELCRAMLRLLIENHAIWSQFGPDSSAASSNPLSNLSWLWDLRKLDSIVPNNSRVATLIERHRGLFSISDYEICVKFSVHAKAFENNCFNRTENIPQFPSEFEQLIRNYV
jgi:hypothetical protein